MLCLTASLAAASAARAAGPAPTSANIFHRPRNAGAVARSGPSNMTYHGGPVMTSLTAYLVFWLPPGVHFSSSVSDANYEQLVARYFQDVGGTPFYNVVTQYPGSNGTPSNAVTLGGTVVDTNPYPRPGTLANPLLDMDIQQELANIIVAHGWPTGLGAMYFVFTGAGIQSCFDAGHISCSQVNYCAYHFAFGLGSDVVIYANMPDAFSLGDCGSGNVNGDPAADVVVSIASHEHFEAVTDPLLDAWYQNSSAGEIGDLCAYDYGPASDVITPNLFLNGHPYLVQREWSNASSACALSLCGASVCAPALTLASDATTCVAGTAGDEIDYSLHYENPSDVDAATNVSVAATLPPGVQWMSGAVPSSIVGNVLTFGLPDLEVHGSRTIQFATTLAAPPPPFTLLTQSAALSFNDSVSDPGTTVGASTTTAIPCGPWCGNGAVDGGEQCDDGVGGDGCCSPTCQYQPSQTACASDGAACTTDVCDGAGTCTHPAGNAGTVCRAATGACDQPEQCDGVSPSCPPSQSAPRSCRAAGKSVLVARNDDAGHTDTLTWKWIKGASTAASEFADPTDTADYVLCIYAGSGSTLVGETVIPAGASRWSAVGSKGYRYLDPSGTAGGIVKGLLRGSDANKSRVLVKGAGDPLVDLPLPIASPVTVQLVNSANGLCWGASYSQFLANKPIALKARTP